MSKKTRPHRPKSRRAPAQNEPVHRAASSSTRKYVLFCFEPDAATELYETLRSCLGENHPSVVYVKQKVDWFSARNG